MPIETSLDIAPYFDDYNPDDQYYRILFKPGVSVQVRELNQLQSLSQAQVERMADNIFRKGTIIDGCNFNFNNDFRYAKLLDSDEDGFGVIPSNYVGMWAKNSANLQAFVLDAVEGFESSDPDLNTIYLQYLNSGNTGNLTNFSSGDILTIYDTRNPLYGVKIIAGGSNFSNSDIVVCTPQVAVSLTSGSFSNGDYIVQPSTGANLQIIAVDEDTLASEGKILLQVKPINQHLANAAVNAASWTLQAYADITDQTNTVAGSITDVFGSQFSASIITNGIGKVSAVTIDNTGVGYDYVPHVSIRSIGNLSGVNALDLTPRNYYVKVKVASVPASIGKGYQFSITPGIIYQKGYMAKVHQQSIIVDKYSNSPNNVVVGFDTIEDIVNHNQDQNLLDNALGTKNHTAPGADRLKLVPTLNVLSKEDAAANTEFNPLVEWSAGQPYKQNKATQYSRIGDEMAIRTFDESGNFVVDTFQVATKSNANAQLEANTYTVVVDPGQAYISGRKTQTLQNYFIDMPKGIDTIIANNTISLDYGNYVRINQLGGVFQFSTAAEVEIYNTPKNFLSNNTLISTGNTNPVGAKIGTAKMRSLILENGVAGEPSTTYQLYLFDIKMNKGQNFEDARSLHYDGPLNDGIADIILEPNPTTGSNVALIKNANNDGLIFPAGVESLKNSSNSSYIYRTIDQTATFANTGILTKSIAGNPNEFYPYTGNLSSGQMRDLYVVPVGKDLEQYTNMTGTISVNSTSDIVTGSGTNFFEAKPGDYYKFIANATSSAIRKTVAVINSTAMKVSDPLPFSNNSCTFKRTFPKNVPIPFGSRDGLEANVNSNSNILTLITKHSNGSTITFDSATTVNTAIAVNIKRTNVSSSPKTAVRSKFVKIRVANNTGNIAGPWCIGVPDVFRLRNVYTSTQATVNTNSSNVTKYFYIDHNQTDNYLDLGWLYKDPRSGFNITTNDYFLVEFDYFERGSEGYFDTVSYLGTANSEQIFVQDALPLANLTTTAASFEVPEVYTAKGVYYDLLNSIDFRPAVANTVAPGSDAASAPVNPSAVVSFGNTADPNNDKKFPLPDAAMTTVVEQYVGRIDSVYIAGKTGEIYVLKGIPNVDPRKRYESNHPKDTLKLQSISVPAYPNVSENLSSAVSNIIATKVYNERSSNFRIRTKKVTPILSSDEFQLSQPMVYTMEDIANLERRIKDLEYYVSMSVLETSISSKNIPSSVDGSLNRFKFGFFADDFSTEYFSDRANPQYAADFEVEGTTPYGMTKLPTELNSWANSDATSPDSKIYSPAKIVTKTTARITPPKLIWSVPHTIKNLPYIDEEIISQDYCTLPPPEPPVVVPPVITEPEEPVKPTNPPPPVTPPPECVPAKKIVSVDQTVYAYITGLYPSASVNTQYVAGNPFVTRYVPSGALGASALTSTTEFNLTSKSGLVTFFFNNYSGYTSYKIFKGDNIIASTSQAMNIVQTLSDSDRTLLSSTERRTTFNQTNINNTFTRNGDFIVGPGKMTFNHDSSTGNKYIIVVEGKVTSFRSTFNIQYPASTMQTYDVIVDPCVINPLPIYNGTVTFPPGLTADIWACSKNFKLNGVTGKLQGNLIQVTGLKPNTIHRYLIDGIDFTNNCSWIPSDLAVKGISMKIAQEGALLNNGKKSLVSDPSGKLVFISMMQHGAAGDWQKNVINNQNKTYGSSGYSTITVIADNSIATKMIAKRSETAVLPWSPAGTP